jgi:hypothetical protein
LKAGWREDLDITTKETSELTPPASFIGLLESPNHLWALMDREIDELNVREDGLGVRLPTKPAVSIARRYRLTIYFSAEPFWMIGIVRLAWAPLSPFSGSGIPYSLMVVLMAAVPFWASTLPSRAKLSRIWAPW